MNTRGGIVLKFPDLSQVEILAISKALADTEYGFYWLRIRGIAQTI